jgi:D-glycerate 3-kinase
MSGVTPAIADFMRREQLGAGFADTVEWVYRPLATRIGTLAANQPGLVVGLCGSQGSGKSTGAALLQILLDEARFKTAVLSIDDLYLPKEDRKKLAEEVDPLLITRGPPGTHDVTLGEDLLDALPGPQVTAIPRFDKARDTRADPDEWDHFEGPADIILFEGWCVGARPEPPGALVRPINELERIFDPDCRWRRYVNAQLAGPYQNLFARLSFLVLLQAPSFEVVARWRKEQEAKLRARVGNSAGVMTDAQIDRFVQYYERLTRFILAEMPLRADAVVALDANRQVQDFELRGA